MAISLFRAIGSLARNIVVANALGSMALFCVILMGGFVLVKDNIHPWTCVILLPVAPPALGQGSVLQDHSPVLACAGVILLPAKGPLLIRAWLT